MKNNYLKILLCFAVCFFMNGCTKYSGFVKDGKRILIKPVNSGIEEISPVTWRVGPRKKQQVSKGFELKIKFPQLENKHVDTILNETEINSWLIVLRKKSLTRNKILSRSYVPLIVPGTGNSAYKSRIKQMKYGYLRVYYPAAALSSRFENFTCPAFKHSLLITKTKLQKSAESVTPITISPYLISRVNHQVEKFEYSPKRINGGEYLEGDYEVEIALYNYESKMIYSNFYELTQYARVLKEQSVTITGCENFVIPDVPPESDGIEEFKFGR